MNALARAFDELERELPRGSLDDDEQVELLKETYRARLTSLTEGGKRREGGSWLLHFDPHPGLRPSALNRCLILKTFTTVAQLTEQLSPHARVLQSCSYLADSKSKPGLLTALASIGVQRFAPAGQIMNGALGAPHDGRFALVELTRLVGDESPTESSGSSKPITGADLTAPTLPDLSDGYIFSSGGTTGNPKFAFFTTAEFARVGEMLARGLRAQGLKPGDRCANLFVAGNLWSSFLAVEKALGALGAVQLPIGGQAEPQLTLAYLERFKPRAVLGLPSLLVSLAKLSKESGRRLDIPVVCYAGEHLNAQGRALLAEAWGTRRCFSAGYASVDAGPIGYQCAFTKDREHHLFAGDVELEIVEGEAVVTSLVRKAMPVVKLRTGDHVEWSDNAQTCGCGSTDPRFILHGRCDGQINLWSCRIQLAELEAGLFEGGLRQPLFQVTIDDDTLSIAVEGAELTSGDEERILRALYEACKDVRLTQSFDFVRARMSVRGVADGALERVPRTGKVRAVLDRRKL
jgi:phenylacetate-coenzyme A ligase PaaK-like adenylate-forming protein